MRKIALAFLALLTLAACSRPTPPAGRWEGTFESGDIVLAARLEIGSDGQVRVSAPDLEGVAGSERDSARNRVASDLASGWESVTPRAMEFDGENFRKPGGIAPQMVWKAKSNQMFLVVYLGTRPSFRIPMRAVGDFSDNPFGG